MFPRSQATRLNDIIDSIEFARDEVADLPVDAFAADQRRQWLVSRGLEIVSEASRHLTQELKARHPEIPWKEVADIGDILRQSKQKIPADLMWSLVLERLPLLEAVCRQELAAVGVNGQIKDGGDQ